MLDLNRKSRDRDRRVARHRPRRSPRRWPRAARTSWPRRAATTPPARWPRSRRPAAAPRSASVDVTDAASVDALVAGALERHGRIDILVNNAGITRDQLMLRMKRDDWDQVIATNLTAAFTCAQAVLKPMIKQRARPHHQHQLGGRADGQRRAGELRGVEGRADRVQQGAGARGGVAQHHGERRRARADRDRHDEGDHRARRRATGRRRFRSAGWARRRDVAAAVCFLASDEASYITGQVLAVNGGMYM